MLLALGSYESVEKNSLMLLSFYLSGIKNLIFHYLPLADEAFILDNASEESLKRVIARKNKNNPLGILDRIVWDKIEEIANE